MSVALSIRQPWAWLIVNGYKTIENRTWRTPYRGPVLIHAGVTMTRGEYGECLGFCLDLVAGGKSNGKEWQKLPAFGDLERGGIVGEATITDCVKESGDPWFVGIYGFVMAQARAMKLVPCKGTLGFFNVDLEGLKAGINAPKPVWGVEQYEMKLAAKNAQI